MTVFRGLWLSFHYDDRRNSELLRRSVYPPHIYYVVNPSFERNNVCKTKENGVRTGCAAIVNH